MAFYGTSFIYDGVPCDQFDLEIYNIGGASQPAGKFSSAVSIIEESLNAKYKPMFLGTNMDKKMEISLVFGVKEQRIDEKIFLDENEQEQIASWLTGHNEYKYLEITQPILKDVRFKCICTSLEKIEVGMRTYGFAATFTCDGPYGYRYPQTFRYEIDGTKTILFDNISGHNGYYKPKLIYIPSSGGTFSIVNATDDDYAVRLTGLPGGTGRITMDNEHCILESANGVNLYPYSNFHFLRLKRGYNSLTVTARGTLILICEFPYNCGT